MTRYFREYRPYTYPLRKDEVLENLSFLSLSLLLLLLSVSLVHFHQSLSTCREVFVQYIPIYMPLDSKWGSKFYSSSCSHAERDKKILRNVYICEKAHDLAIFVKEERYLLKTHEKTTHFFFRKYCY